MKDLVLSQIPRETVLCVLSFGSHHELTFGVWAEGCVRAGQNNLNTTGGRGGQELRTCNKGFLQLRVADAQQKCRRVEDFYGSSLRPGGEYLRLTSIKKICPLQNFGT